MAAHDNTGEDETLIKWFVSNYETFKVWVTKSLRVIFYLIGIIWTVQEQRNKKRERAELRSEMTSKVLNGSRCLQKSRADSRYRI